MGLPTSLRCLGAPTLLDAGGAPVRLRTRKQLALLIYLVMEGRSPVPRDRIADLFWSNLGLGKARHSLGTAIWGLRNRVDPSGFPGNNQTIRTTVLLDTDLDRLARGEVLATDLLPALEVDAFLEEFELPDAPGFSHWRDSQRARLWPSIEAALVRQMDHCRRTGDFTGIEVLAERTLRHNGMSEAAIRARIEARAFAGDRIGALQAFETWKHSLKQELDAEPSAQLEAMARRLRRGTLEGGGNGTRPRVPTEQWKDRTFIGRAREYRTLYEAWEQTTQGEPVHALVIGESGIGKSTLLQRLMTAASLDGAVTSRVQCYELEHEIPYAALGGIARGLLERPEAMATAPQSLADLGQAIPLVHEHFPHLPEAMQLQGESFRIRVTDAAEALLRTIAEETPVMIVVDDFHMADDASVSVLHLLARRFEQERVMIALAARPSGPGESPSIARIRENHLRLGFVAVDLPPMATEEAAEMLDSLTSDGPAPGKSVRDAMLRASGGYPMALELFVNEWRRSGENSLALAVPAMREGLGHRLPPEDAYRMALDRISESLDPASRLVLQLASVLGPRLNELTLYRIVDLGIGATGSAISVLRSAQLLRETEERLEFVNELIRAHAYLSIPKPMRTALHGEVVSRLLAEEAEGNPVPGLEVAWHLIRAGRRDEATPYLLRGARESMRGGAPHEAERGLATAMDQLREPDRSEAHLLLGEALQEQGRMHESMEYLHQVSDKARSEVVSRTNVLRLYAHCTAGVSQQEGQSDLAMGLLRAAQEATEPNTRLRALWMAASFFRDLREPVLLKRVSDALDAEEHAHLSLEDRAEYALGRAFCQYHDGDKEESLKSIYSVLGQLEAKGITNSVYLGLVLGLGAIHSSMGRYELAAETAERGIAVAKKMGAERRLRLLLGNLALCHSRLGDTASQLRIATQASGDRWNMPDRILDQKLFYIRAHAQAMMGQDGDALTTLDQGESALCGSTPPWVFQMWHLRKADVFALLGRDGEALRAAARVVGGTFDDLRSCEIAGPYARWIAKTAVASNAGLAHTRTMLRAAWNEAARLDRLDQLEILNALIWLDHAEGEVVPAERDEMWNRLQELPPAVGEELRRLGMLNL